MPPRFANEDDSRMTISPNNHLSIAILPLGATEQHGNHLPPETDTMIAEGVADRVRGLLPPGFPARFLPAEPIGYSIEHLDDPRTRSLGYDEAIRKWIGIGQVQHEQGVRKLVFLNAHGGNAPLMTIAATEMRVRFGMLAVATSWTRFIPPGMVSEHEKAFGIHGGQIETSVMLALHPDLVDTALAGDFASRQEDHVRDLTHLRAYGPHAYGWKMSDLNLAGVTGNAAAASAALGEMLLDQASAGFVELLADVAKFDLAAFR